MLTCEGNTIHLTRGDSAVLLLKIQRENGSEYELQAGDSVLFTVKNSVYDLSLIHISEPTRLHKVSRMPSSA